MVSAQFTLTVYNRGREAPSARASFRLCTVTCSQTSCCCSVRLDSQRLKQLLQTPDRTICHLAHLPHSPPAARFHPPLIWAVINPVPFFPLVANLVPPLSLNVSTSLTIRISSLRPDPMAKRRVQQCSGSDKNTND